MRWIKWAWGYRDDALRIICFAAASYGIASWLKSYIFQKPVELYPHAMLIALVLTTIVVVMDNITEKRNQEQ